MRQRKLNSEPLEPKYPRRGAPHRNAANRYGQDELFNREVDIVVARLAIGEFHDYGASRGSAWYNRSD